MTTDAAEAAAFVDGALGRVLRFVESDRPAPEWVGARPKIVAEREAVEALIADAATPPIYGFTTLLGHLDDTRSQAEDQRQLLREHLVGATWTMPGEFLQLVTGCKAEQLHHGGSGIHPATYDRVLGATRIPDAAGSWLSSYGSGDVVPAAWWCAAALTAHAESLHQGDLIALINGHFYSTAAGVVVAGRLVDTVSEFLGAYAAAAVAGGSEILGHDDPAVGRILSLFPRSRGDQHRQLPVSLRDARVVVRPIVTHLARLFETIAGRLAAPSANPIFGEEDGAVRARSQSSFLDVQLTLEMTNAIQIVQLLCGVTQRLIEHHVSGWAGPEAKVQPPKVAKAYLEQAQLLAGVLPSRFTGTDSQGVEDLRDLSLLTAVGALRVTDVLREELALATGVLGPVDPALALRFRGLLHDALGIGLGDAEANTLSRLASGVAPAWLAAPAT